MNSKVVEEDEENIGFMDNDNRNIIDYYQDDIINMIRTAEEHPVKIDLTMKDNMKDKDFREIGKVPKLNKREQAPVS